MEEKKPSPRKPDPERLAAFRTLPNDILDSFTREERDAFLFEDVWPDSLKEKLKDYMEDEA